MGIADQNIAKDSFWLNIAAEMIYTSHNKHTRAVEGLQTVIKWAFTLFTTGGVVLFFFPKASDFGWLTLVLFGVAIALLAIGYFVSANSGFPDPTTFNPLVVDEVKSAYSSSISHAATKFLFAVAFTFAGFLSLAVGILFQFAHGRPEVPPQVGVPLLTIKTGVERGTNGFVIPVTIGYLKDQRVDVSIRGYKDEAGFKSSPTRSTTVGEVVMYADTTGFCFSLHAIPSDSLQYFRIGIKAQVPDKDSGVIRYQSLETGVTRGK